ncbi:hypothetical protein ACQCLI_32080 (plasmid) [Pseudomonas nitroreducens]|uniref:hypothetical protein n=1 Tax=Pseudomonas nitroreducens TaxID=46680 RepID=UPI00031EF4E4|nr:hypothetical protein [Pseudomonas nitroreducens]
MEQLTLDGQPVVKTLALRCYLINDTCYYAAGDETEARQLHRDIHEVEEDEIDECVEVVGDLLDKPWQEEDKPGVFVGTLRQWLAEAKEPTPLADTE